MGITGRVFITAVITLLLAAPVAGAASPERLSAPARGPAARSLPAAHLARAFTPLAARLLAATSATPARGGSATLTGTVSTYRGPLFGGKISWAVPGAAGGSGKTTTNTSGLYSFTGAPAASGNGSLLLEMRAERVPPTLAQRSGASWPGAGATVFDFPFRGVGVDIASGGPWSNWSAATVWLTGRDARSDIVTGTTLYNGAEFRSALALPGVYDTQEVYWFTNQGQEYHQRMLVSPATSFVVSMDFLDEDTGWMLAAPVQESGVYVQYCFATQDGGVTWDKHVVPAGLYGAVAVDFADAKHGWAVGPAIYATTDGGVTWTLQTSPAGGSLRDVAALDATHACAVGDNGSIVATDGSTWETKTSPLSGNLKALTFWDATHGLAGGAGGVLATSDGGQTWTTKYSDPDATFALLDTRDGLHVVAAAPLRYSSDGGATWQASSGGVAEFYDAVDMANAATGWLVTNGGIFKTSDGGESWTGPQTPYGAYIGAVAAFSDTHAIVSGGTLIDTLDGQSWSATTVEADQASAPRVIVRSPLGASGKPGSQVKFTLSGLPKGYGALLTGRADYPVKPARVLRSFTSSGGANQTVTMIVPKSATPGYLYWFGMKDRDGALWLEAPFQVSTLKASRTSVSPGSTVTFSGIIPTKGHIGSKPGVKKRLHLWMSTRSATRGFQRVDVETCKGNGSYTFANVRPKKTAWWIAVYNADSWYWMDATSPVKVTVR